MQNKSQAVMQQRHETKGSLDYFPTPPWATRALCEELGKLLVHLELDTVWEPACGAGHMARPLAEYFKKVTQSDICDRSNGNYDNISNFILDYLTVSKISTFNEKYDWVITNPPFNMAATFIEISRLISKVGCAFFVRTSFLEGQKRYKNLFSSNPPTFVFQFVERVSLVKGRLDKKASSATSYCWMVWIKDVPNGTELKWIAPCRKRLERDSDYD